MKEERGNKKERKLGTTWYCDLFDRACTRCYVIGECDVLELLIIT